MRSAATTANFRRISVALILSGAAATAGIAAAASVQDNSGLEFLAWGIFFVLCAAAALGAVIWAARWVWSGQFFSRLASAAAGIGSWIFCAGIPIVIAAWVYTIMWTFPIAGITAFLVLVAPPVLVYFPTLIAFSVIAANRRTVAQSVLGYIEQSIKLNLPLPRMILAAAHSERRLLRKRLLALHDMLDQGLPLDTALAAAVPEVSEGVIGAAGSAQRTGRFAGVFRKAAPRNSRYNPGNSNSFYAIYPILFLSLAFPVISMLMIFVMPKFRQILADFHTSMPWSTRLLLNILDFWGPAVLFIGLLAFAIPLGAQVRRLFPLSRSEYGLIGLARDQLLNWLPISRGFLRSRAMSELCDLLATLVENGQPMDQALLDAAESQSNALWSARIRQWAWNIASGQSIQDAARSAQMPALLVGMIATTSQSTTLAQVLQFVGRYYESRFSRLREMLLAAYIPVMVLLMAAIVLLIDLSIFQPLIAIDNKAAIMAGGF